MRTVTRLIVVAIVVFAMAVPAHAEVMDKEPSAVSNWAWAVLGGTVAVAAWRWRWWAGLMVALFVLLRLYAVHLEIQDPFVGPAIRREAGQGYVTQFYSVVAVWLFLNGIGVYVSIIAHRRQRRLAT